MVVIHGVELLKKIIIKKRNRNNDFNYVEIGGEKKG